MRYKESHGTFKSSSKGDRHEFDQAVRNAHSDASMMKNVHMLFLHFLFLLSLIFHRKQ